jgi:hypothetical protein
VIEDEANFRESTIKETAQLTRVVFVTSSHHYL